MTDPFFSSIISEKDISMNIKGHELLIQLGTKSIPHQKGSLYNHLSRVEKLLLVAECQEHVASAGLFHSIYGNEIFKTATTNNRTLVQEAIGIEAENLAWLFCNVKRPDCYVNVNPIQLHNDEWIRIDQATMFELKMIEGANILDHHTGDHLIKLFGFNKELV